MAKRLILCDCSASQTIDSETIERGCSVSCSRIYSSLCTDEIGEAAKEIKNGDAVIACLQEQAIFQELAEEIDAPMPGFLDLRDRAGWSEPGAKTAAKMVALVNDALLPQSPVKMLDIQSTGQCLILGNGPVALDAADQLADILSVTVLLAHPPEMQVARSFDVIVGRVKQIGGSLGRFSVRIDALQQLEPGGRGALAMGPAQDGGHSGCDIILDMSGRDTPFFAHPRDGYLRADPRDLRAVNKAILAATQLVGGFEKPLYVDNTTSLCAHSRAGITGCSACIDNCQSSAIQPDGEFVSIDPNICDGCGDCVALCPSGALTFSAPETSHLLKRIQVLASGYLSASVIAPKLLVHDSDRGSEMISLAARFGRGLPDDVVPLELESTALFGHAEMLAALASGFAQVNILLPSKEIATTQESQTALANAIAGTQSVHLLHPAAPDALSDLLYDNDPVASHSSPILAQGSRRQIARLAGKSLQGESVAPIPLPVGAPYGALAIDTDACTLCLSCVSLCPSGALSDNPDSPELRFVEDACLQCGLCTRACPEKALTLVPRLDISDAALNPVVLHHEDPFACISCGALFGVKSTVDKIIGLLEGKHPMFATSEAGKLIQMCDKCRIEAQYHSEDQPFQTASRPKTVTTEDYFSKRKDH